MRNRILCTLLCAALCLSMAGCNRRQRPKADEQTAPAETTVQTTAPAVTEAPTETAAPTAPAQTVPATTEAPAEAAKGVLNTLPRSTVAVPLDQEESDVVSAMGDDVQVVSDSDYITTVSEILNHAADFSGLVFQIEGVLQKDDQGAAVGRTLVNGEQTTDLGIPVNYLEKDIANGAWVRLTGVISADDSGKPALDVVAAEALAEYGQVELPWDGAEI